MKKNNILLPIIAILLSTNIMTSVAWSQENNPTAKPTVKPPVEPTEASSLENSLEKNAQILKDKIATKVAELSKQADVILTGVIKTIDDNSIILTLDDKKETIVLTDEVLTTYKETSIRDSDTIERNALSEDDYIVVSGKKIDNDFSAIKIYLQEQYIVATGQITEVDAENFTVSVVTVEKDQYELDIEKTTITQIMDTSSLELSKAGFSKLKIGDNVHFVIKKPVDAKAKTHAAIRLLIIPQEYFTETEK